jgi:hypothetical protein
VRIAAHADGDLALLEHFRVVQRSVLHTAIGVVHQAGCRSISAMRNTIEINFSVIP